MKFLLAGKRLLMNLPKYCFDTHPLIWYFTGQKTLTPKAKKILDGIFTEKLSCFIPSIVFLEAFHLSLKNKKFIFPQFLRKLKLANIIIVPLDKVILSTCYRLSGKLNIHDRIICATAVVNGCLLITKDKEIGKFTSIKTVW